MSRIPRHRYIGGRASFPRTAQHGWCINPRVRGPVSGSLRPLVAEGRHTRGARESTKSYGGLLPPLMTIVSPPSRPQENGDDSAARHCDSVNESVSWLFSTRGLTGCRAFVLGREWFLLFCSSSFYFFLRIRVGIKCESFRWFNYWYFMNIYFFKEIVKKFYKWNFSVAFVGGEWFLFFSFPFYFFLGIRVGIKYTWIVSTILWSLWGFSITIWEMSMIDWIFQYLFFRKDCEKILQMKFFDSFIYFNYLRARIR